MTTTNLSALQRLKLTGMSGAYQGILDLPLDQHPDGHELLARLLDAEAQARQSRRQELYLRVSKMRYRATLHDINPSPQRNLSRQQLSLLSDLAWIDREKACSSPEPPAAESLTWPARSDTTPVRTVTAPCTLT